MLSGPDIPDFLADALRRASLVGDFAVFNEALQDYGHLLEPEERARIDREMATVKLPRPLEAAVMRWQ